MENYIVFDNGGKTTDRYTAISKESGDIYGMSTNPFAPDGVGNFIGNCAQAHILLYGTGWRERLPPKKVIKTVLDNIIIQSKLDPDWIGELVSFDKLPDNVKKYITQLPESRISSSNNKESNGDAPVKYII
ncbi:MAG: hypothetical protein C5B59_00095 [Bacteroidetes bacterium]|nr:MAG: hypothetical protein C5B59_00095 [Bacteroidota bacterium]